VSRSPTPTGRPQTDDASWTALARVVPNGDGSEFMLTFFQPQTFGDDYFKHKINLVDGELAKHKEIMKFWLPLLFAITPILGLQDLH
jgi:hypothetical protein